LALKIGAQFGSYEITSLLGKGGMGVVYRARDMKLGRDVAIKVLPAEFSHDRERVARAEREARMLASLNHPNVAAIYDLKEWEGNRCLVLEYVEGETLADALDRGRLAIVETLNICLQITAALEAVHRTGIIHRDIKPANIKVTRDGRVKVLDFGLAKSFTAESTPGPDSSAAPTLVTEMLPETLVGTPAYMSPEQIRGEIVDHRADIWAFGCVVFELLSGQRPFPGGNTPEIIASVLKSDPEWSALPEQTPSKLKDLLRRCLEKDPRRRLNDIAAARIEVHSGIQALTNPFQTELPSGAGSAARSLAVLPFVNASGKPEMDYLSDGLTESIIFGLSGLPQLRLISRSTVFRYKGRSDEAEKVGRELGVAAVLTGRVLQRNEALLISAELVDVENGWQLWGDQFRRKSEDIFTIEEDIAREISEKLSLKLTPEKKNLLSKRYPENVEAYHLYLKGRYHWGKRTAEGLNRGIQYFRQAIEVEPAYALAYAGLAEGYVPLGVYCHLAPKEAFPKARSAAEKALAIDPQLAEARAVLASIRGFFELDLIGAEKDSRAAVDLDPKYPRARQVLSECLTARGKHDEAIAEAKRALDLDPLSLHLNAYLSLTCYFGRRYKESIEHGLRTVELDSNFFPGYFCLGLAYAAERRDSEAAAALQQARTLSSNSTLMLAALGGAFASGGKQDEARGILHELEESGRQKYVSQVFVAAIHAGLGENDQALTCLQRACEDRDAWLLRCLTTDERFDALRAEPRFQDLLLRAGATNQ
jgi:serine/threonine-protein kinase